MKERLEHFQTFITGGNAPFVLNGVNEDVRHEKNLVLIGLNKILEYNK